MKEQDKTPLRKSLQLATTKIGELIEENYRLKEFAKWSENDKKCLQTLIEFIGSEQTDMQEHGKKKAIAWLSSLPWRFNLYPDQLPDGDDGYNNGVADTKKKAWKPSEKQMECLDDCVNRARDIYNASTSRYDAYPTLKSLYNDLQKLM